MTDREYLDERLNQFGDRIREHEDRVLAALQRFWNDFSQLHRRTQIDLAEARQRHDELRDRVRGNDTRLERLETHVRTLENEFQTLAIEAVTLRRVATDNLLRMRRNLETVRGELHDPERLARLGTLEARLARLEHHPHFLHDLPDPDPDL